MHSISQKHYFSEIASLVLQCLSISLPAVRADLPGFFFGIFSLNSDLRSIFDLPLAAPLLIYSFSWAALALYKDLQLDSERFHWDLVLLTGHLNLGHSLSSSYAESVGFVLFFSYSISRVSKLFLKGPDNILSLQATLSPSQLLNPATEACQQP